MTIVLPYKPDELNGLELKYALRSIEKYLSGYSSLIIIGTPPDWYKGEYIKAQDYDGRKQYTIYQKVLLACELDNITDSFIFWNDDHFLLKPLGIIKLWHNGALVDELKRELTNRYYNAVKNTLQILPDALNYDIHVPIVYKKKHFKTLFQNKEEEICIKSYYSDWCKKNTSIDYSEYMPDLKINELISQEAIKELIKDRLFFSTSIGGIKEPMKKVLQELYPNPSHWEK